MNFEFWKYTDITDFAFKHNSEYEESWYVGIYICPDVNSFWLIRLMKDRNEDYDVSEWTYLIEREEIIKDRKDEILTEKKVKEIIENDTFENYDILECYSKSDAIETIDWGYWIL